MSERPTTLGELIAEGYRPKTVKDEVRDNLVAKLKKGENVFPGILGYEKTVLPALHNAILARHDIILLGLRGQAKTRLLRALVNLLDEEIPVLAGSAAYAVAETFRWPSGLGLTLLEARGFYTILSGATLVGVGLGFTSVDPIKALYWAAVVNGVIAVPIMVVMMLLSAKPEVMGRFTSRPSLRVIGWLSTAIMGTAVIAMFVTL